MNILFIHQNFPGQFRHAAKALAAMPGHRVIAIGQEKAPGLAAVKLLRYRPAREPSTSSHRYLIGMERAVLAGQQIARVLLDLKREGFVPDVIVAHPGWGETLYAKDVFPTARLIHFCEFYYHAQGADAGFDPAFPQTIDDQARIRMRNALHLLNLEQCDVAATPTHWQKSLHPQPYHAKLHVIHEGVDTEAARPDAGARFELPDGRMLTRDDPVVTYVARNLEPYRGYPQFIRALALLQQRHPTVQALIVGGDEVSYGSLPASHPNWRERMAHEVTLDPTRTHHLGKLPYQRYLDVLRVGTVHAYLTYPFVLSWSMLEALSCGCHVVASDTAPVREVVEQGRNGWLVDFFDVEALARTLLRALDTPAAGTRALRANARNGVARAYGHAQGTDAWLALILGQNAAPAPAREAETMALAPAK